MVLSQQGVTMENCLEEKVETKKEWIAPELKKIDLEQLTAGDIGGDDDGAGAFS
jgi:hypothetical protein